MNLQQTSKLNMWPSIISGASSLLGGIMSINEAKKNRKFQAEQAQLNRQFNHDEAQLNRDFQYDMFNKTNEYNDPSKVVNRFKNAGLNPALAFGGFANAMSPIGDSASSSASPSGSVPDLNGISSAGSAAALAYTQNKLANAQAENIEVDTKKKEAELPYAAEAASLSNQLKKVGIDLNTEQINLTKKQIQDYDKQWEQINANIDYMASNTDLVKQNIELLKKENFWKNFKEDSNLRHQAAEIQQLFAKTRLTDQECARLGCLLAGEIALQRAQVRNLDSQTDLNNQETFGLALSNLINDETLQQYGLENMSKDKVKSVKQELEYMDLQIKRGEVQMYTDAIGSAIGMAAGSLFAYGYGKGLTPIKKGVGFATETPKRIFGIFRRK